MDLFKKNKLLGSLVFLLVFVNTALLAAFWVHKMRTPIHSPPHRQHRPGGEDSENMRRFLEAELAFGESQIEDYMLLQSRHRDQVDRLNREIRLLKKEMFDEILKENPRTAHSDSLLDLSLAGQAEIERLTLQYFLDLKALCEPEQQRKLQSTIHKLLHHPPPPPPPPAGHGRARPGFKDEAPSPQPPGNH